MFSGQGIFAKFLFAQVLLRILRAGCKLVMTVIALPAAAIITAAVAHKLGYIRDPMTLARQGWQWVTHTSWIYLAGIGFGLLVLLAWLDDTGSKRNNN